MSDRETGSVSSPSLPGYEILAELGRDRLGGIYHARHRIYGREVALRVIDDRAHEGLRDLTEVCHNADKAGKHPHPHLLALHEAGENESQLYFASELPPGPSLRERLEKGPMTPNAAAALVATLARAVSHLHLHHALHLGLTSNNVFLAGDGSPRVGDVGLSGLLHDRPGIKYVGDPAYAAPEQIAGERADERTDVYGLGCLLAECLTTHLPTGPLSLQGCPTPLANICRKALSSDPERRHASAAELAEDLDRFRRGDVSSPGKGSQAIGWLRRNPAVAALTAALVLVLIGAVVMLLNGNQQVADARADADRRAREAEKVADDARKAAELKGKSAHGDAEKKVLDAEYKTRMANLAREKERKRTLEEERGRLDAERRFSDESKKRALAEEKTRLAEQATRKAEAAQTALATEFDRLHVAHGNGVLDGGDYSGALAAFARALNVATRARLPTEAHRLRIAATLERCPRPMALRRFAKGEAALVQFAANGKRFLVVGTDGVATIRDAGTGELLGKKMVHGAAVPVAVLSPDGTRVLSADARGQLRLWNAEDASAVFEPIELESVPMHLSFSGDGKRFLLIRPVRGEEMMGAEAQVRDAANGDLIGERITEQLALKPGALSFDGLRVLLCGTDRAARLYESNNSRQVGGALSHGGEVASVAISPDGRRVVTAGDGTARVWLASTGKEALAVEHASAVAPQFDEAGRLVLTVDKNHAVRLIDAVTGKQAGADIRARTDPRQAALSPDGRFVLVVEGGTARLYDIQSGRAASGPLTHSAPPVALALSPDAARALTFDGRILRVWDMTAGEPMSPPGHAEESGAVYTLDGKRLARVKGDSVQVHDAASGEAVGTAMKHKGKVIKAAFSAAGDLLVTVTNPADDEKTPTWDVRVWDAATGKALSEPMEHLREVSQAHFAGATHVLTASLDKKARLWEAKTGKMQGKTMEMREDIVLAELSPDGKRVVVSDKGGMTRAWSAETGEPVGEGGMPSAAEVKSVAFSGDSKLLATCCEDGSVGVWVIETNKRRMKVELAAAATHAVFSSDGKNLLTGCADGTARLWNMEGDAVTPPLTHDSAVTRTAFSGDGRWLLTAAGNAVRIWDAKSGEAVGPPIPHSHDSAAITAIAYSNGELMTQAGPGSRWARTLIGDRRAPANLIELAVALSGREDVGGGRFVPASDAALQGAWRRAEERTPSDFAAPSSRLLAWAKRGAAECEARGLWAGAARHLDVLLASSSDASLYARRGKANAELGRHQAALADYGKAIGKGTARWEWWAGRGDAAAALGRWEVAAADYAEAAKREDRGDLWRRLGRAEAERGRWKEAAQALAKAARSDSGDPALAYEQIVALLSSGDTKGYREACARMLKKFGRRADAGRVVAEACILAPEAVADYKGLLEAAEATARAAPENAAEQLRLAALLVRAKQSARAVPILEKLTADEGADSRAWWLLILAQLSAGQKEKAKESQSKAEKSRESTSWAERQAGALWRKEAEAALEG